MRENYNNCKGHQTVCYRDINKSWNLRNDSSGVGGALHPDYICDNQNYKLASMPNISTSKRVLISSKKQSEEQCCSKNIQRKLVKECYCNSQFKKVQLRSTRTQHKQHLPCKCSKSPANINLPIVKDNLEKSVLTSPISCETLRRVQKIDYAPRSQFLRNVQNKVSHLQIGATGDCPEEYSKLPCHHEFMARKNIHSVDSMQCNTRSTKSKSLPRVAINSDSIKEGQSFEIDNEDKSIKKVSVSLKKPLRPKLVTKKTLTSKKSVSDLKKTKSNPKTSVKSKRASHLPNKECPCCHKNKVDYPSKSTLEKDDNNSKNYQHSVCVNDGQEESDGEYHSDNEIKKLKNFREQNYFDTHGSGHTLLSSKSSGSLEQYLLNDRLFPESSKRIHKKDLVVTMPACATLQRKRMHYFPRYIVRQESNTQNTNYKKKRCQNCPLTGHAIDLGITKIRPPLNSLALKYQKRLP